jgi:hypothetical protein
MKRRTFVYLTVASAAAIAAPFAACRRYSDSLVKTLREPEFLAHICDDKTIRDIGAAWCTRTPDEAKQDKLIPLLLASVGVSQDRSKSTTDSSLLIQQLDSAVRGDYATSRVVTIRGWVLSLTEARQCALYSISQQ